MKFGMLPRPICQFKLLKNLVRMINIQWRDLNFIYLTKCMFKIGWCLDTYKPISFILGIMVNMTKLYIMIPCVNDFDLHSNS